MEKKLEEEEKKMPEGLMRTNLRDYSDMYFKEQHLQELTRRIPHPTVELTYCLLTGIAGSGKTELARHYTIDYFKQHPSTFSWRMDPDSASDPHISYRSAYRSLLENFDLKEPDLNEHTNSSNQTILYRLWQKINRYPEWIVIFDNAVYDQDVQPYLPPSSRKGLILITTQNNNFFIGNNKFRFYSLSLNEGLDPPEAVQLLKEVSGREESGATALELVNKLDRLPLGVRVAGGYIKITEISFTKYAEEMERNLHFMEVQIQTTDPQMWSQLVNEEDRHKNLTLQSAIRHLVLEIKKHKSVLYEIMEYCGYLNNEEIPRDLLIGLYKEILEPRESILTKWREKRSGENLEAGLNILMMGTENYSLITYEPRNASYKVHRTTQMVMRGLCVDPIQTIKKLVAVMTNLYHWGSISMVEIQRCQKLETHVLTLSQYISSENRRNGLKQEEDQIKAILGDLIMSQLRSKNPDSKLLKDRRFVLQAVKRRGEVLRVVSEELQKDKEIVLAAVKQHGFALRYASSELQNDKECVVAAVQQNGWVLESANQELKNDKEIVLAAVQQDTSVLRYASQALLNDKEIILTAVKQHGPGLQYASQALLNDKEIILTAVKQQGRALAYASSELKKDKELVLIAVQQEGLALQHANEEMQNDRQIVLEAVVQNGDALEFASQELKNDKAIVLEAVVQNGDALEYASQELKNDKEIVFAAVQQWGGALEYANPALQADKELVLTAVQQWGGALESASQELKNDREIVLAAVRQGGTALESASEALQADREIVLAAVVQNGKALQFANEAMRNDPEILKAAAGLQ